jgi:hypothetical protein
LGVRKISGIEGLKIRIRNIAVDDRVQFLDGGKPPVGITAIIGIIQSFDKVFGIRAVALGSGISTIGSS